MMIPAAISPAAPGTLSAADFAKVARIAHVHAGIVLHPGKSQLVASRLARLQRSYDCDDLHRFVQLITDDAAARVQAIEALTTNHTKFFREEHHFQHVASVLRPMLLDRIDRRQRVRLWSAGSSTGEEVYSLGMTLLGTDASSARTILDGDVALLATDINTVVVETGRAARYAAGDAAAIPADLASRWTQATGGEVTMAPDLRGLVRFRQLNLLDEWPIRGQFDAIFCRNTMIYFDDPTTERLQCRLADRLVDGGFLYLGHSERLLGEAARRVVPVGQTIFRKVPA
ncbi:CheR family methyltransferase [Sphingomonas jinjuensis]|nr:protein-glutamate O-methyltransferase CheR [Sphingomonas jinjuensis]